MCGKETVVQILTAVGHLQDDDRFIDKLLQETSRTFALAIPLLAAERQRQIGLSYLLFRVADSIEDAPEGDVATKISLLNALKTCLHKGELVPTLQTECVGLDSTSFSGLWPTESPTERLLRELQG